MLERGDRRGAECLCRKRWLGPIIAIHAHAKNWSAPIVVGGRDKGQLASVPVSGTIKGRMIVGNTSFLIEVRHPFKGIVASHIEPYR